MKKNKILHFFLISQVILIISAIMAQLIINYPFILLDRENVEYTEKYGWVRLVESNGKKPFKYLQFAYYKGEEYKYGYILCTKKDINVVNEKNCELFEKLKEYKIEGKNYTKWAPIKINSFSLDIPIFNLIYKDYFIVKNLEITN